MASSWLCADFMYKSVIISSYSPSNWKKCPFVSVRLYNEYSMLKKVLLQVAYCNILMPLRISIRPQLTLSCEISINMEWCYSLNIRKFIVYEMGLVCCDIGLFIESILARSPQRWSLSTFRLQFFARNLNSTEPCCNLITDRQIIRPFAQAPKAYLSLF